MAGLILKLRPREQLLINGVVVENGDRKAQIRVCTEGAQVLRLRNAMRPEDATTPIKRACYAAQMAVAGALNAAQATMLIEQALADYQGNDADELRDEMRQFASNSDFYGAMRRLNRAREDDKPTSERSRVASA